MRELIVQSELGYWNSDLGMWVPRLEDATTYSSMRFEPGTEFNVNAWWMNSDEAEPDLGTAPAEDDPSLLPKTEKKLHESKQELKPKFKIGDKVLAVLSPGFFYGRDFDRLYPAEADRAITDGIIVTIVGIDEIRTFGNEPKYIIRLPHTGETGRCGEYRMTEV